MRDKQMKRMQMEEKLFWNFCWMSKLIGRKREDADTVVLQAARCKATHTVVVHKSSEASMCILQNTHKHARTRRRVSGSGLAQ